MARCVLVYGPSGSGKSSSMRNFTEDEVGVINVMGKEFPFRTQLKAVMTKSYMDISKILLQSKVDTMVVDDAGYLMTDYFMKNHANNTNGFAIYNEIADSFYTLVQNIKDKVPDDKIVYLIMHEDGDELNGIKPKTLGKLLNDKVCVEGMFTIVLRSMYKDGKYVFATHTNGTDVTKSPLGMFAEDYIDNDLKEVTRVIKEYYNINSNNKEKNNGKN